MLNLYEAVRTNPGFKRLEIGDLLFAEYTCPIHADKMEQWTHSDYLVHVLSGKKAWHTSDGTYLARTGDTLFFRKGAAVIEQFFEVDFCLLLFFIPDELVKGTVREIAALLPAGQMGDGRLKSAVRVENDVALQAFFQSMRAYFSGREKPSEPLLRLKLKELIVSILTSRVNRELARYFRSVGEGEAPPLAEIMEANFRFNLSLQEFAAICHRSLSSFKRDFQEQFHESPGKWLVRRRLEYAAALLLGTNNPVTDIVFESGFEDVSHFSRVFKQRFALTPTAYREGRAGARLSR